MDRLLALALQQYEDGLCPGCGQPLRESMDGDLLEEWTTVEPHRCGACTALARASDRARSRKHPEALRYVVGLREGWEERRDRAVQARIDRGIRGDDDQDLDGGERC